MHGRKRYAAVSSRLDRVGAPAKLERGPPVDPGTWRTVFERQTDGKLKAVRCYVGFDGGFYRGNDAVRRAQEDKLQRANVQNALQQLQQGWLAPQLAERASLLVSPSSLAHPRWKLPAPVIATYAEAGITQLYDWQASCLSHEDVLFHGRNLVFCAPTSGGKSIISEILLLHRIWKPLRLAHAQENGLSQSQSQSQSTGSQQFGRHLYHQQQQEHMLALVLVPFVVMATEKATELQRRLGPLGLSVIPCYAGHGVSAATLAESVHVAVCTYEKGYSIVNKLVRVNDLTGNAARDYL